MQVASASSWLASGCIFSDSCCLAALSCHSLTTQALRAGVIKSNPDYYSCVLPETWTEGLITNHQSGVFCMPRYLNAA